MIILPQSLSPFTVTRECRFSSLADALMDDVVAVPFLQSGIFSHDNGFCYQLPGRLVNVKPSTYCLLLTVVYIEVVDRLNEPAQRLLESISSDLSHHALSEKEWTVDLIFIRRTQQRPSWPIPNPSLKVKKSSDAVMLVECIYPRKLAMKIPIYITAWWSTVEAVVRGFTSTSGLTIQEEPMSCCRSNSS